MQPEEQCFGEAEEAAGGVNVVAEEDNTPNVLVGEEERAEGEEGSKKGAEGEGLRERAGAEGVHSHSREEAEDRLPIPTVAAGNIPGALVVAVELTVMSVADGAML